LEELVMIVWRGWGILSIVIGLLAMAAVQLATRMPSDPWTFRWHAAAALAIAAVLNFWAGWRLNRAPGRLVVDTTTGRRFEVRGRHDLFFIPMQYWSIAFALAAAALLLAR
jgi:hypothetical protein